jgi:predicted esterase
MTKSRMSKVEVVTHRLAVTRTAHYATLGQTGPAVRSLWIVCHGYGQLARRFIRSFQAIARKDTLIVAPEGLSRFYWGGFDGPVVASWMTREDRLAEIADYSAMLSQLYDQYTTACPQLERIVLFGFSQGTATIVRWLMRAQPHFDQLMLWAGQLPEDIDYSPALDYFADKQLSFAYGDEDPFITPERMAFMREVLAQSKLNFQEFPFSGRHDIPGEALREWWAQC